jgi:F0F1-type ATP synthase assembly protein I
MSTAEIKKKILKFREQNQLKRYKKSEFVGNAFTISIEIVASIAVGLLIGFYLDEAFNFKFLFKILCSMLAFVASFVNIYRTAFHNHN